MVTARGAGWWIPSATKRRETVRAVAMVQSNRESAAATSNQPGASWIPAVARSLLHAHPPASATIPLEPDSTRDIAAEFLKRTLLSHEQTFEPALQQVSHALMATIEPLGVRAKESAEAATQIRLGRFKHQVIVIFHPNSTRSSASIVDPNFQTVV